MSKERSENLSPEVPAAGGEVAPPGRARRRVNIEMTGDARKLAATMKKRQPRSPKK